MFINKGVYLRFVTDELKLRTLQLLPVRNLAAIDAHWVMYITTAYQRCVRMYLHTRGSSLLVSTGKGKFEGLNSWNGHNKVPRLFYIVERLSEPQTFITQL